MTINARYKQLRQKYDVIQSVACDIQQEIMNYTPNEFSGF